MKYLGFLLAEKVFPGQEGAGVALWAGIVCAVALVGLIATILYKKNRS